jgi:hypothetical protein
MSEHPTAVSEVFSQDMMVLMGLEECIMGVPGKEYINILILR